MDAAADAVPLSYATIISFYNAGFDRKLLYIQMRAGLSSGCGKGLENLLKDAVEFPVDLRAACDSNR